MVRPASDVLADAISGSREFFYSADLYRGDERIRENLPISAPSLTWDASGEVEGSGSLTVEWADENGSSLSPVEAGDDLAPFGARLVLFAHHRALSEERIQLGVFTVVSVPSADDVLAEVDGDTFTVGSRVQVRFQDRMIEVKRDRFTQPSSPSQLTSVYTELQTLTGLQLTRTVADAAIPRSIVYDEERTAAVQDLAGVLGGVAFMEWDGTLSVRSNTAGATVAELTIGEQGTVAYVGAALDSDGVYNGVVITSETDDQTPIRYTLWVTEGPLRATPTGGTRTPFHRVPRFFNLPLITTQAQAVAAAPGLLEQVSQPRASELEVQCLIDPRLQVGDVVSVFDGRFDWVIRLTKVELGLSAYMTVKGSVISRELRG